MTQASPVQHGIWFTERAGDAGTSYHLALRLRFDDSLDHEALTAACEALIDRHESLRSAFAELDGELRVIPAAQLPTVAPGDEHTALTSPFDLEHGPLARFVLNGRTLLVVAHHLVFDGMSKDVLVADLAAFYSGLPLPSLPASVMSINTDRQGAKEFWGQRWRDRQSVALPGLIRVPAAAEPGQAIEAQVGIQARELGVSRFEMLVSALLGLLHRYGDEDPALSVDVSTRREGQEHLIGALVNELPVAVGVQPGESLRSLALRVRAELRELYRYREVPVARAVGAMRPRAALTPLSLSYRRRSGEVKFAGTEVSVDWAVHSGSARNALHVQMVDDALSLQFSPEAIAPAAVRRILDHLQTLLHADPDLPLDDVDLLAQAEKDLLERVNDTARPVPAELEITGRAVCGGVAMSAEELLAAADGCPVPEQKLLPLTAQRSFDLLIGLLAAWRQGRAFLPLDPAQPQARRDMILDDARPEEPPVDPDLAYVMYTSGSTGRPKGVQVTRANLTNLLAAMSERLGCGPQDVWLAHTSIGFDISLLELLLPLVTGGTVVIAEQHRDGPELVRLIEAHGVTHVQATPSGWRMLLDSGLRQVDVALAGGEALPEPLAAEIAGVAGRVFNVYGPTETTIWSTVDELDLASRPVSIGFPLANTTVHVVGPHGFEVPPGCVGELRIGGAGVARGYLGREELTAEKFTDGQYHTGDLVRLLDDGRLAFLGRADGQMKIRGHRVEAGEVETRLLEHPAIRQAAVALRGERLIAYLVGDPVDSSDLRDLLSRTLAPAAVPAAFVPLDALPLTPNGKLDRAALPDPPQRTDAPLTAEDASELEETVREVWQEVLEIDAIGLDEDLFDLGVHSLIITRALGRLRKRCGVDVPMEIVFDTPTIREIAVYIEEKR